MNATRQRFEQRGVVVLTNAFPPTLMNELHKSVLAGIERCALSVGCALSEYLESASRWVSPSPVTESTEAFVNDKVSKLVKDFWGEEIMLSRVNIIAKSKTASLPVPCHQDIAYSKENPYQFSLWVPLQEVHIEDGPLHVLPTSHLGEISPAVDFWSPHFIDRMASSPQWKQHAESLPLALGDAIVFDSRLWHGSRYSGSGKLRLALVTRWQEKNYQPTFVIPDKKPDFFGMWSCGEKTQLWLKEGLVTCFQEEKTDDFIEIIECWQEKLTRGERLGFEINAVQAKAALQRVKILHQAAMQHNGGDAQGVVYADLWRALLKPLYYYLEATKSGVLS